MCICVMFLPKMVEEETDLLQSMSTHAKYVYKKQQPDHHGRMMSWPGRSQICGVGTWRLPCTPIVRARVPYKKLSRFGLIPGL